MSRHAPCRVLLADDDPQFTRLLEHHLRRWGFESIVAHDKRDLLVALDAHAPTILLLDVCLGDQDGLEILQSLRPRYRDLEIVMLTAFGSIQSAVAAVQFGAADYLTKPVDLDRLRSILNQLADRHARRGSASEDPSGCPELATLSRPLLGTSRAMCGLRRLIADIAPAPASVLILGESGVGKELVARALHELSPRSAGPFVALNVAALPRELAESTLFGHEKGAFTGADRAQAGCCEVADKGTLFLDEIGEMEINLQAKLLRFLQDRSFQRVGRSTPSQVDVRVVAATNRDPRARIREGLLREDLFYRLNVLTVRIPPLRDRREDIPPLASEFLARAASRYGRGPLTLHPDAMARLTACPWPGNIRQLENTIERLAILARSTCIGPEAVQGALDDVLDLAASPHAPASESDGSEPPLREIDRVEKQAILEALGASGANVRAAARRLGLGAATVYRKIKRYGIDLDRLATPEAIAPDRLA